MLVLEPIFETDPPLYRREEGLDELPSLIVEILRNAVGNRDRRAFQFQHAERNAVDVDHHVRALGAGLGGIGEATPFTVTSQAMASMGDVWHLCTRAWASFIPMYLPYTALSV